MIAALLAVLAWMPDGSGECETLQLIPMQMVAGSPGEVVPRFATSPSSWSCSLRAPYTVTWSVDGRRLATTDHSRSWLRVEVPISSRVSYFITPGLGGHVGCLPAGYFDIDVNYLARFNRNCNLVGCPIDTCRSSGSIFSDGFESGDLSRWSLVVG